MDVVPLQLVHEEGDALQQEIESVIRAHDTQVTDEIRAAVLSLSLRRHRLEAIGLRPAADDDGMLGRNATSPDRDFTIRLVRRDHAIGAAERPALGEERQTAQNAQLHAAPPRLATAPPLPSAAAARGSPDPAPR